MDKSSKQNFRRTEDLNRSSRSTPGDPFDCPKKPNHAENCSGRQSLQSQGVDYSRDYNPSIHSETVRLPGRMLIKIYIEQTEVHRFNGDSGINPDRLRLMEFSWIALLGFGGSPWVQYMLLIPANISAKAEMGRIRIENPEGEEIWTLIRFPIMHPTRMDRSMILLRDRYGRSTGGTD